MRRRAWPYSLPSAPRAAPNSDREVLLRWECVAQHLCWNPHSPPVP
jgi:hypothetical protein